MRIVLALAFILCLPRLTEAQLAGSDRAWMAGEMTYVGLAAWDAAMTITCARQGICKEANPFLTTAIGRIDQAGGDGTTAVMVASFGVQLGIAYGLHKWRPHNRKGSAIVLGTLIVVKAIVIGLNYRTLSRRPGSD